MSDEQESRLAEFPKQISFQCNNKIIDQMEKCTCKIKYGIEQGTGFFTKIPISKPDKFVPVLVLCNHTHKEKLEEKDVISVIIQSEKDIKKIDINGRKKYTSKKYDVTIIELKDKDNISPSHYILMVIYLFHLELLKQDAKIRNMILNIYVALVMVLLVLLFYY